VFLEDLFTFAEHALHCQQNHVFQIDPYSKTDHWLLTLSYRAPKVGFSADESAVKAMCFYGYAQQCFCDMPRVRHTLSVK
jgi:hypothetical protein